MRTSHAIEEHPMRTREGLVLNSTITSVSTRQTLGGIQQAQTVIGHALRFLVGREFVGLT